MTFEEWFTEYDHRNESLFKKTPKQVAFDAWCEAQKSITNLLTTEILDDWMSEQCKLKSLEELTIEMCFRNRNLIIQLYQWFSKCGFYGPEAATLLNFIDATLEYKYVKNMELVRSKKQ